MLNTVCRRDGAFVSNLGGHTGPRGDLAALDADHAVEPVHLDSVEAQRLLLAIVKRRVRELVPDATEMHLDLNPDTDGCYGFKVIELRDSWGRELEIADGLLQDVEMSEMYDLNWAERGGVVGEDRSGTAVVELTD